MASAWHLAHHHGRHRGSLPSPRLAVLENGQFNWNAFRLGGGSGHGISFEKLMLLIALFIGVVWPSSPSPRPAAHPDAVASSRGGASSAHAPVSAAQGQTRRRHAVIFASSLLVLQ